MSDEPGNRALEEELRHLTLHRDPVPPELMAAAVDAFGWRDVDAELASLVFDSLLDTDEASLVRSSSGQRLVSFRAGGVSRDGEVTRAGAGRTLTGQIEPPQQATVDIRRHHDVVTAEADELGRFRAEGLPAGPVSLRLRRAGAGGPSLVTDWVRI
jgi:hypothetical protein